jgi:carboxyl-terminal processing protease
MMWKRLKEGLQSRGRYIVAIVALAVAFGLSVQFGDRGVQFDLNETSLSASSASSQGSLSKLKVFNRALLHIKDNYVKPDRIDPGEMLVGALDRVQNLLPPVVIEYEGDETNPSALKVTVEEETKTFKVKSLASLWQMSFRLRAVFEFVEQHVELDEDQKPQDIEYAAINGMLSTLDPHSNLLPPKHFEEMQTQTGGEFGGLGIVISIRDGRLTVISPIDGTPAAKQGVQARDQIVRIEDASTINMNLQEAVSMLRGKPGTEVDIWIDRKGWSEPKKFTVTRDVIKIKSVNSEPLADKVGYIRIKNFQGNTYSDMKTHLKKLKKKMGGMQGLVLDLRDNPGGLLDQAIKVSDLFLEKGTIVSTVGAGEKMREKKVATKKGTEPDYPMVVLVNAGSASASEIVSGALQNHKRALVLGDTTFGKGTVQVLYEFDDGSALKLTIAEYLTPGGVSIQSRGIVPDLRLIPAFLREKGPMNMFLSDNVMREADLEAHFSNQGAKVAEDKGVAFLRYLKEEVAPTSEEQKEEQQYEDPNKFERDFPISLGQRLLASFQGDAAGDEMLEKLQPELETIYSGELEEIKKKLSNFDVDWAAGPTPDDPKVSFETTTSIEGDRIKAGGKLKVTAKVTNKGEQPLYRLKAITSSANDVLDDREFLFGKVAPGESQSWTVDMEIPKESATRHDLVTFELSDEKTDIGEEFTHVVPIERTDRPSFAFNYEIKDDSGDGTFQVGEEVTFTANIRNTGSAPSDEVVAYLKNQSDEAVYLEKGRLRLDPISSGEMRSANFKFRVKEKPKDGADFIDLRVDVYDSTYRGYLQRQIKVPFVPSPGEMTSASGLVEVTEGPAKLFTGADAQSGVVGQMEAGTKLPVTQRQGDWWKIKLKDRAAWIQNDYVSHDETATTSAPALRKERMYAVPDLNVDPSARMTDASEVELTGSISDNTKLKDYYIFVYHREGTSNVKSRKIGYEKVQGAEASVSQTIPLYDGMNRITLIARDEDSMTGQRDVFVYSR